MTFKLAFRNIRRSIQDYVIYFVTLVLGIAVFYAFNSIESQQVLFDIESTAKQSMLELTQYMLSLVSYAIAVVLGFLVVYANRFLIRRRKREFGTYLVLGMSPGRIASIVLVETIVVGLISLVVGLAAGIMLAQGLSFATAALFQTTISNYQFVFSQSAFAMTLICFAVIYVIVALLNLMTVSRFRLISLLQANRKNEKNPVRNPWISLVVFIISIGLLAYAYSQLHESGMVDISNDPEFTRATIFMLIGTLAFFWSLAGFLINVITRLRGIYLRGLVPFTVRQFSAKINTGWATLWVTCVMMFFAITIFSTGMGLVDVFVGDIERYTPYDATLTAYPDGTKYDEMTEEESAALQKEAASWNYSVLDKLESDMPHWDEIVRDAAETDMYELDMPYSDLMSAAGYDWADTILDSATTQLVFVIPLSQLNDNLRLLGESPIELDGEYAIVNTLAASDDAAHMIASSEVELEVGGQKFASSGDVIDVNLAISATDSAVLWVVVPDSAIEALRDSGEVPEYSYVNVMYRTPGEASDEAFGADLAAMLPPEPGVDTSEASVAEWVRSPWPVANMYMQVEMREQAGGLRLMITYLALYIGFVLLVATAAILAIQQLTEAVDSLGRYKMLSRLGCDSSMLNRSLFVQVLIYFLAPLALAAAHSACAIDVLSDSLFSALGMDFMTPILFAAGFTVAIYAIYMLITYVAARQIIKPRAA